MSARLGDSEMRETSFSGDLRTDTSEECDAYMVVVLKIKAHAQSTHISEISSGSSQVWANISGVSVSICQFLVDLNT